MIIRKNLYLLKLAYINIRRNINRSLFIGFSVCLTIISAVWIFALFQGLNRQIIEAVIDCNVGNYQILEQRFSQESNFQHPASDSISFNQDLNNIPGIISHSKELLLSGYIHSSLGTRSLELIGGTPESIQSTMKVHDYLQEGDYLEGGEGILIGKSLSNSFKLSVGEQLIFNYQDVNGELRSEVLNIIGIYKKNGKEFEKSYAYVNKKLISNLYFNSSIKEKHYHRIILKTDKKFDKSKLIEVIKKHDFQLKSWRDINPEMNAVVNFHEGMINCFLFIVAITTIFTILTPTTMLWQERLPELKMMNIIGMKKSVIWRLGFFEAIIMTFFSFSISIIIILIIIGIQSRSGVDFSALYSERARKKQFF